jgi:SulP family sulfate permease
VQLQQQYLTGDASKIFVKQHQNDKGNNVYEVHGTLFFASKERFQELFNPKTDTNDVYIDFGNARVLDHSVKLLDLTVKITPKTLVKCRLMIKKT